MERPLLELSKRYSIVSSCRTGYMAEWVSAEERQQASSENHHHYTGS